MQLPAPLIEQRHQVLIASRTGDFQIEAVHDRAEMMYGEVAHSDKPNLRIGKPCQQTIRGSQRIGVQFELTGVDVDGDQFALVFIL